MGLLVATSAPLPVTAPAYHLTTAISMQASALVPLLGTLLLSSGFAASELPHLRQQGTATQLIVDGQPFLVRGGELGNSSGEPDYLRSAWPKLQAMNLNTVIMVQVENEIGMIPEGRHVRLEPGRFSLQRVKLYRHH